jgi:hypothetical protein
MGYLDGPQVQDSRDLQPNLQMRFRPNLKMRFRPNLKMRFRPNLKKRFRPNLKMRFPAALVSLGYSSGARKVHMVPQTFRQFR